MQKPWFSGIWGGIVLSLGVAALQVLLESFIP